MASAGGARAVRELLRVRADDVGWALFRADNSALIAGLLGTHLGDERRRLPDVELYELLDADLDALRDPDLDLPMTAQGYCADWLASGYLVRRPLLGARGESLELSPGALNAIVTLRQLVAPRQSVTESRLQSVSTQLSRLAIDTDPDFGRRLTQLELERSRIDAEIERVRAGDVDVLDDQRALERVRDILAQAQEMPSDFARVRAEFDDLNRRLREWILDSEASHRPVLEDVFRGVDLIAESDEGRTFAAFSALVLDPDLGDDFDDSLNQLLSRAFSTQLSAADRQFLRRFIPMLKDHAVEIHTVMTNFARGLRRYVQTQEFQRDRALRQLMRDALAQALEVKDKVKPYSDTGLHLQLSAVAITSVGNLSLHDPSEFDASEEVLSNEPTVVDLAALRLLARETEIDFAELVDAVDRAVLTRGPCSVAEVLELHPATQGVASVIGLLALAASHGVVERDAIEAIAWTGTDGVRRSAHILVHRFEAPIAVRAA